mmetsp:Transcript_14248/g.19808  ORF Transcript_14248/g.19808 Transcript_14248/m.19808 type:complete len:134 (-) Transcript_14248:237-638(-)
MEGKEELKKAAEIYKDWTKLAIFDDKGAVIHSSEEIDVAELKEFLGSFDDRDKTVGKGLTLDKEHYDVHRCYDNLVYGRKGKPGNCQGICVYKFQNEKAKKNMFAVVTWGGYATSARIVPELQEYCKKYVATL